MIDELIVRNLGLIEHAQLLPGPKLTVITGETVKLFRVLFCDIVLFVV